MPRYEQLEEAKLTPEQRHIWDECRRDRAAQYLPRCMSG
jgi:hypothetical protein